MKNSLILILAAITAISNNVPAGAQKALDDYIRYGLENNLALRQKQLSYEKSIMALREARGLFYPEISFQSRYTRSEGGRVIEFPVGDLLNPVYYTLNSLTSSSMFPMIDNQQVRFLRPEEQETRLRLVQPIFNTDIWYNTKIRKELSRIEEYDISQYRRELTAEIRKAYYNSAMADGILRMLGETRPLLVENVRVNRKLIENGKATADYLFRSEAELDKFDQQLQESARNRTIAFAYFNFLLNRPLDDSIIIQQPETFPGIAALTTTLADTALQNREELMKLSAYGDVAGLRQKLEGSARLPGLFVAVDYGFQGTAYRFNSEHDYMQASAVLSWTLFKGFQRRSRMEQARQDRLIAENRLEEARKQISLQVISTLSELGAAEKGITAAESRLRNASESFRLVKRKFEEGQASQIEFIDARSSMTQAAENLIISRFSYLSAYAGLIMTAASENIEIQ